MPGMRTSSTRQPGFDGIVAVEEVLGRGEGLHLQPHRLDQPAQAAGDGLVVVN
jgi:hypothetical protein